MVEKYGTRIATALSVIALTACNENLEMPRGLQAASTSQNATYCFSQQFVLYNGCPALPTATTEVRWFQWPPNSGPIYNLATKATIELFGFGPTYYYADGNADIPFPPNTDSYTTLTVPCFLETGQFRLRLKRNNGQSLHFAYQADTLSGQLAVANGGPPPPTPANSSIVVAPVNRRTPNIRQITWNPSLFGNSSDVVRITLREVNSTGFQFKYYTFNGGSALTSGVINPTTGGYSQNYCYFPNTGSATLDMNTVPTLPERAHFTVFIDKPLTTTAYQGADINWCAVCTVI